MWAELLKHEPVFCLLNKQKTGSCFSTASFFSARTVLHCYIVRLFVVVHCTWRAQVDRCGPEWQVDSSGASSYICTCGPHMQMKRLSLLESNLARATLKATNRARHSAYAYHSAISVFLHLFVTLTLLHAVATWRRRDNRRGRRRVPFQAEASFAGDRLRSRLMASISMYM